MTFLGVDVDEARMLARELRVAASYIDPVLGDVTLARSVAAVSVPVDGLLDQIEHDCLVSAARIEQAVRIIESYRLVRSWSHESKPPVPFTQHVGDATYLVPFSWTPEPARWDGTSKTPWNQLHQESSHNSYLSPLGVVGLYDLGVRSFEFDIHRGAPTDFSLRPSLLWESPVDHVTHGGAHPDDWWVYHTSFDSDSEYDTLREGLHAVAALPATDPLTVYIDVKDAFTEVYGSHLLNRLLIEAFGDRLFVPADMMARAPEAESLHDAVVAAGWPTVDELQARVMIVLTGDAGEYEGVQPQAFLSASPRFALDDNGTVIHLPDASIIFYNERHQWIDAPRIAAINATGMLIRTYGHNACGEPSEALVHYRAMDIDVGDPRCA